MMSSVGLSAPPIPIAGHEGIGGGAAAISRRSSHGHPCDLTVAILDNDKVACPLCCGAFRERLDSHNSSPSSPLPTVVVGSVANLRHNFLSSTSDFDSDIAFSFPLPPRLPPPLAPSTTDVDAAFYNFHNDVRKHLPPPLLQPPPPPLPPPFNLLTTCFISGFDSSENLDNYLNNPPPPPPPPLLISNPNNAFARTSNRISHRLPTPPPQPPSRRGAFHLLPLPPPRPSPAAPITSAASSSSWEIQLTYPLPPPPPPSTRSPSNWDHLFPYFPPRDYRPQEEDPDDRFGFEAGVRKESMELEEEKFLSDRKMIRSEESSPMMCTVCLENLEQDEAVKRLPCKHIFHSGCILTWLDSHRTCPVCRYKLPWNCVTNL